MIFDSDILIWFLRGHDKAADLLQNEPQRFMSQVTWMEIIQGARNKRELAQFKALLPDTGVHIIPLSAKIGDRAVAYLEEHSLKDGLMFGDALVGATAAENDLTLATANVKHFRCLEGVTLREFKP